MSDMADVLREHGEWRYTNGAGSAIVCRECGAPVENVVAHQAAALSAAGFGPVQGEKRLMQLAALMAYDAVEENKIRDARAGALEDAADDPKLRLAGHSGISITRLRARAVAERGAE